MEYTSNSINKSFQKLFSTTEHPFFTDIKKVNKISKQHIKLQKEYIKYKIDYEPISIIPDDIKINMSYKLLKKQDIDMLSTEMNNMNWKKIHQIVSYMSQFILQSNVKNEKQLYKDLAKSDDETINIMIIGSGPIGLYLACYLHLYYNKTIMNSSPRVKIVLFDNRIDKPGFRKPYNRHRPFVTSSSYLNLVLPKIYCNNSNMKYLNINIYILEYLLYTIAISHYNIPIIYNIYKWEDYLKIIEEGKFKVVFDCSGGKLQNNAISNVNTEWIDKLFPPNKQYNIKINKKLIIESNNNIVLLAPYDDMNKFIKNHYYSSLSVYKYDKTLSYITKYDIDITNNSDLKYINKLKNKNYTYTNIILLIKGIKNNIMRNFLFNIIINHEKQYSNYLFIFDIWSIYIKHAIKISDIIQVNKHKALYIGAGDTIFHSHFIVGAGLNRTLDFTIKCANKLINLT